MRLFRKLPVTVAAVQITDSTFDNDHPNDEHIKGVLYDPVARCAYIDTLEGRMRADLGDWIVRGIKGELYPVKPDIFALLYEGIGDAHVHGAGIVHEDVRFWFVWTKQGYVPRRCHNTETAAHAEAERLARKHPGQKFIVLRADSKLHLPSLNDSKEAA